MLITLEEYANKCGVKFSTIRSAIHRGKITPTTKIKNRWYIEDDTPWIFVKKTFHGESNTHLNNIWRLMKQRCYNPNNNRYEYYGGKGIKVCDEWLHDYMAFRDWALSHGYKDGLTIDRIDSDKDYEPNNCQWLTRSENSRKASALRQKHIDEAYEGELTEEKLRYILRQHFPKNKVESVLHFMMQTQQKSFRTQK